MKELKDTVQAVMDKNPITNRLAFDGMALSGEAGETANKIKKMLWYPGYPQDIEPIVDELSDVLFHVQALCITLGVSLEDLSSYCVQKQKSRL